MRGASIEIQIWRDADKAYSTEFIHSATQASPQASIHACILHVYLDTRMLASATGGAARGSYIRHDTAANAFIEPRQHPMTSAPDARRGDDQDT